jgi:hypothetical protein
MKKYSKSNAEAAAINGNMTEDNTRKNPKGFVSKYFSHILPKNPKGHY